MDDNIHDDTEVRPMGGTPIAEGLFTWPSDEPRLIGGRCGACGALSFPVRTGCARCGSTDVTQHELGSRGTLWTWTSQGFVPKEPFAGNVGTGPDALPWYVGLVELPGELRVESLLVDVSEDILRIGMPVRLVVVPFRRDEDGDELLTFAFTPDPAGVAAATSETELARA
jgi:uncharacterized OB-fold protein